MGKFFIDTDGKGQFGYRTLDEHVEREETRVRERAAELLKQAEGVRAGYTHSFEAMVKLTAAGFECEGYDPDCITVNCKATDLPTIYKAIGRVKMYYKNLTDPKKRLVTVTLKSEVYPVVRIVYEKKIPRAKKGEVPKCRIVRTKSVETHLVCSL